MSFLANATLDAGVNLRPDWRPRTAQFPPFTESAGPIAIRFMDRFQRPLDPWQRYAIHRGLGYAPDSQAENVWAAEQVGIWVPRQNGKGDVLMALELFWLFVDRIPLICHSAHEYKTAQEAWMRICGMVKANPELDSQVLRYWKANGEQGIELKPRRDKGESVGPRLRFMARTAGAGRGFSAGKLILDEAQELTEEEMAAILFVMSAQQDPQIFFFGTPPKNDDAWVYNLKDAGESGAPGTGWINTGIDWVDTDDVSAAQALKEHATWYQTNPSLGIKRSNGTGLRLSAIEKELTLLGPGKAFAMERCGMWLPPSRRTGDHSINPEVWAKCAATKRIRPPDPVIGFYIHPRRTHAVVTFAGKVLGKWRVGIVDSRPGVGWLPARLAEIKEKYDPIAFTVDTEAEAVVVELASIGIRVADDPEKPHRGFLALPKMRDVATAFGLIVDAANNSTLMHHDESPLNVAVQAPARPLAGGSTFDHRKAEVGPACSVALAMWAHREYYDKVLNDDKYDPLANIW